MNTAALIIGDIRGLEKLEIRQSLLRIPEVSMALREANMCLEKMRGPNICLFQMMMDSPAALLQKNHWLYYLHHAIQKGLFTRYCGKFGAPSLLVGSSHPLGSVISLSGQKGYMELAEKIKKMSKKPVAIHELSDWDENVFSIWSNNRHFIFERVGSKTTGQGNEKAFRFKKVSRESLSESEVMEVLASSPKVGQLVEMSYDKSYIRRSLKTSHMLDMSLSHAMEIDPFLSWFSAS